MVMSNPSVVAAYVSLLTLARCAHAPVDPPTPALASADASSTASASADASSTASAAQPTTTGTPPAPEPFHPNYALPVAIPLSLLAYFLVARALGIRLSWPDLAEPWRSLLAVTATAAAVLFAGDRVAESLSPTPLCRKKNSAILFTISVLAWMVLVIQVVRDHGMHNPLAVLFAMFAVAGALFFTVCVWDGKPIPLTSHSCPITLEERRDALHDRKLR